MTIAVLVNLRSRRGSEKVADMVRSLLPRARLAVTRTMDDLRSWLRDDLSLNPPTLVLSGGGDGTAVSLLNELRAAGGVLPAMGLLPLGTGNGWSHATGAPSISNALRSIASLEGTAPPLRRFRLVETEGKLTPFAGVGWDAEIVSDFQKHVAGLTPEQRQSGGGLIGYMQSMFLKTIPRHVMAKSPPMVTLVNEGEPALAIDAKGNVVPVPDGEAGAVLYSGPLGVAGAGTTEELGFGFRAFPFAHVVPDRMAVRVYGATAAEATLRMPQLWRGKHPMPKSVDYLLTACRMDFDRDVAFEVGGDVVGQRRSVSYRLADEDVGVVDWRAMRSLLN